MKLPSSAVRLTLLGAAVGAASSARVGIAGAASKNNYIISEVATDDLSPGQSARPVRIVADAPLTVHRYDDMNNLIDVSDPIREDEAIVLVTSNCGTTEVLPKVEFKTEGGQPVISVELGLAPDDASSMPFLESSSYDVTTVDPGCNFGGYRPEDLGLTTEEAELYAGTTCMDEAMCDERRKEMGLGQLYAGNYRTKGCFTKEGSGIAFWGRNGSVKDKFDDDLPGEQRRITCETTATTTTTTKPAAASTTTATTKPAVTTTTTAGAAPLGKVACETREECDRKRSEMGVASFYADDYRTKGCFIKNGIAFWGSGGSPEEMATIELTGAQERLWCDAGASNNVPPQPSGCEAGPSADPAKSCAGAGEFCRLDDGACNGSSGVLAGVCAMRPEACIEIYQPVCGCDGNTWSNGCKAHEAGVSVSRQGVCKPDGGGGTAQAGEVACLTKDDCDAQRQKMGIQSFYAGNFPTRGCFSKGSPAKAFFSEGSVAEMSTPSDELPAQQDRIWCTEESGSASSMLQVAQAQYGRSEGAGAGNIDQAQSLESPASSAFSLKAFSLGSLLHTAMATSPPKKAPRSLDTCTYNVEVLLAGCSYSNFDSSRQIEVQAPKARVIQSVVKDNSREVHTIYETDSSPPWDEDGSAQYYDADFLHTFTLAFPDDDADTIDVSANEYESIAPLDEDACAIVVCGRPFVDSRGASLIASPLSDNQCSGSSSSWLGNQSIARPEGVVSNELGNVWTRNALGEHASVASFAAFSIALMTNQAPSDLVEDALKAAMDEVRHAKVSFEIASLLAGKDVAPGPLPASNHEFKRDLMSLAVSVAKEGCIDESLSALIAAAEVEVIDGVFANGAAEGTKYHGVDTKVLAWIRDELQKISIDESTHAALAWRTLSWVCSVDSNACDAVKSTVLNEKEVHASFERRVRHDFEDAPELMDRMANAWRDIHNGQGILAPRNSTAKACEEHGSLEERSFSLIPHLVETISCGR